MPKEDLQGGGGRISRLRRRGEEKREKLKAEITMTYNPRLKTNPPVDM